MIIDNSRTVDLDVNSGKSVCRVKNIKILERSIQGDELKGFVELYTKFDANNNLLDYFIKNEISCTYRLQDNNLIWSEMVISNSQPSIYEDLIENFIFNMNYSVTIEGNNYIWETTNKIFVEDDLGDIGDIYHN